MSHTMTIEPLHDVEYPESDGEPMAETDVHRDEMLALIDALKWRFRKEPDVYVAGNNFVYYEEGTPKAVFSPDVYVVRGVPKGQRRTFKLWQERHAPCFVMELSSRKTWLEDIGNKKALCQHLGIAEYFLYDPEGDVVKPPLQGFRLEAGRYEPIAPDTDGHLASAALGIIFRLDEALRLHARDASTGELLLRPEEVRARAEDESTARRRAEEQLEREADARRQAEAERDALAARLRDLEGSPRDE